MKAAKVIRTSEVSVEKVEKRHSSETIYKMDATITNDFGTTEIILAMMVSYPKNVKLSWWGLKAKEESLNHGEDRMLSFETFTNLGIELDLSEINEAVLQKEEEIAEAKKKEDAENMRRHREEAWDKSMLINQLKPLLEASPRKYKVVTNLTKEQYIENAYSNISLIVNNICIASFSYNGKFIATKNYGNESPVKNIPLEEGKTRSAKLEKMAGVVDAFLNHAQYKLDAKKNAENAKDNEHRNLEKLLGVSVKVEKKSSGHYESKGRWVQDSDDYVFSPDVTTDARLLSIRKTKVYNGEKQKYVDCYNVQLPYIASPEKLKALIDLFNK